MLLAIDVGNTRIKAAVFEGTALLEILILSKNGLSAGLNSILDSRPEIGDLAIVSVGNVMNDAFLRLNRSVNVHFIDHKTAFPFQNLYLTPHTLGTDRIVLAAGAVLLFPRKDRLVIDAGTCITYDFIDSSDRYHGGAISPGIRLRYEALHQYTANLPLLTLANLDSEPGEKAALIGSSTAGAIHSGVINGTVGEIDGFIDQYRMRYPNFIIILTGGDAEVLAKRLKNTIFANSNFLIESLNQTYLYKIKND